MDNNVTPADTKQVIKELKAVTNRLVKQGILETISEEALRGELKRRGSTTVS